MFSCVYQEEREMKGERDWRVSIEISKMLKELLDQLAIFRKINSCKNR